MAADDGQSELSAFQLEVARMFFALPISKGFLLAGGAALLAQHLTARPTDDLDFFTTPEFGHVPVARDALEAAARQRGWTTERIHDSDTFCRMVIRSADAGVLIDLAVNAPPDLPASATPAGPTLAPEELAGHKLLALFDRAAARDFADVYVLARRFGKDMLLTHAKQIDAGFDTQVLAGMITTLDRFTDSEIPVPHGTSAAKLRAFYVAWRSELTALAEFRRNPARPANRRSEDTDDDDEHVRMSLWIWPLPPPGPVTVTCQHRCGTVPSLSRGARPGCSTGLDHLPGARTTDRSAEKIWAGRGSACAEPAHAAGR